MRGERKDWRRETDDSYKDVDRMQEVMQGNIQTNKISRRIV